MKNTNKPLDQETLRIQAEDNQVGNLTNWRGLGNNRLKKQKILQGLDFINAFIHRGIVVQVSKIKGVY